MKFDPHEGFSVHPDIKRASVAPYKRPVYMDQVHTTPGWREIGQFFSLVEHPVYVKNPAVTKAIREFDPTIVPMGCCWVFDAPSNDAGRFRTEVFYRHALGRYKWDPWNPPPKFNVAVPPGYCGPVPNILERVLDCGGREPNEKDADLPGPYEPWDWPLYYKLRFEYCESPREVIAGQKRVEEARQKRLDFMKDDFRHEMGHLQKFVTDKLEHMSDIEIRDAFNRIGRTRPEVKPSVHLGS